MTCWIFDVDGVILNLLSREKDNTEIFDKIINLLRGQEPVALITGRSIASLSESVLDPLENRIKDPNLLNLLAAECEFGGASVYFSEGSRIIWVNEDLKPHETILAEMKKVPQEYSYVTISERKNTFATLAFVKGGDFDQFKITQKELTSRFEHLVSDLGLENLEVHNDNTAVNVKDKSLNKHTATKRYLSLLKEKGLNPDDFVVFGDSESDFQIGTELHIQGKKLKFVYTGEADTKDYPFVVIKTNKKFEEGTLEYLQNH